MAAGDYSVRKNTNIFGSAGFILSISGTVPDVNDKYQWERFCFEIVDLDGHQIDKILVTDLGKDYTTTEEEKEYGFYRNWNTIYFTDCWICTAD